MTTHLSPNLDRTMDPTHIPTPKPPPIPGPEQPFMGVQPGLTPGAGQGWLTPFGEDVPQLFRDVPGFIGGFSQNPNTVPPNFATNLLNAGGFKTLYGGRHQAPVPGTNMTDYWRQLVKSGQLRPETMFWLLGMMRGDTKPVDLNQPFTIPGVTSPFAHPNITFGLPGVSPTG